jgi:NAD(P)-dependent dehydrogenase (short-subunit alcohol dehydrogenase family)
MNRIYSEERTMNLLTDMTGHVAVIAGGGSGIGAASAKAIAKRSAHIVILDLNLDNAKNVADEISKDGGSAEARLLDVTSQSAVNKVIQEILADHKKIGILVNSVGVTGPTGKPSHELSLDDYRKTFEINFYSAIALQSAVMPTMLERGYGRIMQVASIAGKEGNPNMGPYSTSKGAMISHVKSSAKEVASKGITVNTLAPAVIATPINDSTAPEVVAYMISRIPMGRVGQPFEVGELIAWVVSPACSFTTGFVFDLTGGRATY